MSKHATEATMIAVGFGAIPFLGWVFTSGSQYSSWLAWISIVGLGAAAWVYIFGDKD